MATAVTPVVAMPAAKMEKRRQPKSVSDVISTSFRSATKGGLTGAAAQGVNVGALMWLRTVMNYQMVNGGSMTGTLRLLLKQGGVPRLYRGLVPALFQSPMSRFGDTFANAGALALLEDVNIPIALKTACASVAAGGMRILLMPIDAWKTNKQVHGSQGLKSLTQKGAHGRHHMLLARRRCAGACDDGWALAVVRHLQLPRRHAGMVARNANAAHRSQRVHRHQCCLCV